MLGQLCRNLLGKNVQKKILRLFVCNLEFLGPLVNLFLQLPLVTLHLVELVADNRKNAKRHCKDHRNPEPDLLPDVRELRDVHRVGRKALQSVVVERHHRKLVVVRLYVRVGYDPCRSPVRIFFLESLKHVPELDPLRRGRCKPGVFYAETLGTGGDYNFFPVVVVTVVVYDVSLNLDARKLLVAA